MEKKPILNIMVDLETASTKENAAILSWAMVPFFTDGTEFTDMEDFYRVVSLTSCFFAGMDVDKDTQDWWMKQEPKAKSLFLHAEDENIHGVAMEAYTWLSNLAEKYDLYMWARGLDFDIPKMEWCFSKFVERPLPYKYSHKMDVRTVLKFMQIDQSQFEMQGVKHNALDDCKHDIRMIQEAYKWKEKWMMAYTAMEAGKTAKELKEKRAKEDTGSKYHTLNVPELFKIIPVPHYRFEDNKGIGFSWYQIDAIETTLRNLKESCSNLEKERDSLRNICSKYSDEVYELKMQLKDLQAKA